MIQTLKSKSTEAEVAVQGWVGEGWPVATQIQQDFQLQGNE